MDRIVDRVRRYRSDEESTSDAPLATDGGHRTGGLDLGPEFVQALPFWLPAGLLVALFVYGAIGWNFLVSLTDWSGLQASYWPLDFGMYTRFFERVFAQSGDHALSWLPAPLADLFGRLLTGPIEYWSFRNTIVLLIVFTVLTLIVGLLLAILIDQQIRFENTFRTIYLLPMSLSFVVTAVFWQWMYNPRYGIINSALETVGLDFFAVDWIGAAQFKLLAVIIALTWQFSGYGMVVYLAGLRAIPNDQFEAARVDGAGTIKMYLRVIIPQLRAATLSAAVVLMVFALKAFDFLYVIFGSRPGPGADILSVMMYRTAFDTSQFAYGAAIATILFVLALGVIMPYLYIQYQRGDL
ncbi:carbohydrate ABC transporter permease [Halococcoides cellulosivorans]|uniref:carbohydrate ABC transporter permease n=1 Tax=Halococcoides cellulosivorans TaxID=1679096 RepID=UPI0037426033